MQLLSKSLSDLAVLRRVFHCALAVMDAGAGAAKSLLTPSRSASNLLSTAGQPRYASLPVAMIPGMLHLLNSSAAGAQCFVGLCPLSRPGVVELDRHVHTMYNMLHCVTSKRTDSRTSNVP